ncbi:ABC transporter permease subunit [Paenibacillus sp. LHD-117]|uniref:ABC transporter permease n=1 Tax=Paenibacillus sp. LHD-117 TaxID=3071412 RepID=UPI0027DEC7C5|nr:ABC transporter permease subunit [Paenibacillus sp. LHD-117]MDQ6423598.1 ABC transporter permease subunit [Paenibacillus sp. LHD-117]
MLQSRFIKNLKKDKMLLLLLLPGTLYLIVNNYIPMFGIIIAFKDINYAKGILGSDWVGFKNFEFLFHSIDSWLITRNTVLYNAVFIVLNTVVAIAFAVMLNEMKRRFLAKFFQSVIFLPYFLSMILVGYLGYALMNGEFGYINKHVLVPLGFDAVDFYSRPDLWIYILPLVNLWKNVGYLSVIFLAAIIGIDNEYYEAAVIDGASKWQQVKSITIPLIMPVIVILTLLAIGRIFYSDFGLFYQVPMDAGALYSTTNVIDTYVYRALLEMGNIGMSAAAGLYQSFVGLLLVLGANLLVRKINKENALI